MDPRVLDAMLPYMTEQYGNPHSRTHAYGWEAEAAVDNARKVGGHLVYHLVIFDPINLTFHSHSISKSRI